MNYPNRICMCSARSRTRAVARSTPCVRLTCATLSHLRTRTTQRSGPAGDAGAGGGLQDGGGLCVQLGDGRSAACRDAAEEIIWCVAICTRRSARCSMKWESTLSCSPSCACAFVAAPEIDVFPARLSCSHLTDHDSFCCARGATARARVHRAFSRCHRRSCTS